MAVTMKRRSCSAAVEVLQRVAQPAGHAVQRVADLRDLARAGGQRLDVELAAGDALGVGGQPRQRLQHPAPEEHDDDDERGAERGQAGAERDRPARGRALARHPQHAGDARQGDGRSDGSVSSRAFESPCWNAAVEQPGLSARAILAAMAFASWPWRRSWGRSRSWRRRPSGRAGPRLRAPPGGARARRAAPECPAGPCAAPRRPGRGGGPRARPATGPPPPTRPGPRARGPRSPGRARSRARRGATAGGASAAAGGSKR